MKLDKFDTDTLKDFVKYTGRKDVDTGDCWEWVDEQASDNVIQALGIIAGFTYLHFVPQKAFKTLPNKLFQQAALYDYQRANDAINRDGKYPAPMTVKQLHRRAKDTLKHVIVK